jgi:hypothetical protein
VGGEIGRNCGNPLLSFRTGNLLDCPSVDSSPGLSRKLSLDMRKGWRVRTEHRVLLAGCLALLPPMALAQNPPVKDCRTPEAAGNFLEPDDVIVDNLVCKLVKAGSSVSSTAPASKKDVDAGDKKVVLGEATTPENSAPLENATMEVEQVPNLAEVARAYRESRQAATKKPEARLAADPPAPATPKVNPEAHTASAVPGPPVASVPTSNVPAHSPVGTRSVAMEPAAKTLPPAIAIPARAAKAAAIEAQPEPKVALPPAAAVSVSAAPPVEKSPSAVATPVVETKSSPPIGPQTVPEPVVPAPATAPTEVSQSESKNGSFDAPVSSNKAERSEVREAMPEPEQDSNSERPQEVKLGAFEAPQETSSDAKRPMVHDPFGTPPEALTVQEVPPGCSRAVSLGRMQRDRLVLATPDWAARWLEKNQKRYPGMCFVDSPAPGLSNYLIVFSTTEPQAPQPNLAAQALLSPSPVTKSSGGTFTTNFGSTWHYTYDNAVTTTVTAAWTEIATQNQSAQTLYAIAYTEQGIPISQHWPKQLKSHEKDSSDPHGRKHNATSDAVRIQTDLLGEMMTDLSAH